MKTAGPEWRARSAHAAVQLVGTVGAFLLLTAGSYAWISHSAVIGLVLAVAAGLALVRVFILQHDCAHRALFPRPRTNDRVGAVLGVLTLAPHGYWRTMHLAHHATSGDLERRGTGDIRTLTAREYRALTPAKRLQYRLFRHPLVLLGLGPIFQFLFRFRLPSQVPSDRRAERRSIWRTNLGFLVIHAAFAAFGDWPRWLLVQLVITQVSAGVGIWLFYVQHQVEVPYWARRPMWTMRDSALRGAAASCSRGPWNGSSARSTSTTSTTSIRRSRMISCAATCAATDSRKRACDWASGSRCGPSDSRSTTRTRGA